jgi:hypothetical protein
VRRPVSPNPTLKTITALAASFAVPLSYFTDGPDVGPAAPLTLLCDAGITGTAGCVPG